MTMRTQPPAADDALFDELERSQDLLAAEIERQEKQITTLQLELRNIVNGPGYRLFSRLWPLWHAIVPPHSRRERFVFETTQALTRIRAHGLRAWRKPPTAPPPAAVVPATEAAHEPIAPPRVSILCLNDELHAALTHWAAEQTWPHVDVVRCTRDAVQRAHWGEYICVGSHDLLQQPATWVETNMLVLARENLAFTLSFDSIPSWLTLQLRRGRLPGTPELPLLRCLARADCVDDDLQLTFGAWLAAHEARSPQEATAVGRILRTTTNRRERFSQLPMRSQPATAPLLFEDDRFFLTQREPQPAPPAHRTPVHRLFRMPLAPDPRPTVVVFLPFLAMGGAERIALDMIRSLAARIRFVVVATDPHDGNLGSTADRFRAITPFVYTAHDFLPFDQAEAFLTYLIERFTPRCLYLANGSAWLFDALPRIRQRFPSLRFANQVYEHRFGWISRYDAALAQLFDANIGVNRKICDAYVQAGVPANRSFQIENPIDAENYDPSHYDDERRRALRRAFGLPEHARVVAFIARIHPQKRPLDFLELARQMRDVPDVHFLMVGDGPLADAVADQLRRINLPNFTRRPFYEPSADVYAIADVVVLPSEYEGMPVVVIEALAMGKPVVVTDVGNARELIELTGGGIVVPRIGDVTALRAAVQTALRMQLDTAHIRATLIERFGMETTYARYEQALLGEP
jgi:glycosyltransferase involved in cell wall biosynthesis